MRTWGAVMIVMGVLVAIVGVIVDLASAVASFGAARLVLPSVTAFGLWWVALGTLVYCAGSIRDAVLGLRDVLREARPAPAATIPAGRPAVLEPRLARYLPGQYVTHAVHGRGSVVSENLPDGTLLVQFAGGTLAVPIGEVTPIRV